jgi:aspartyl-tRNA(Asn)/glutamyl-tRNA(Gln) amidotransferase subunit B
MPELPNQKNKRFINEYQLDKNDAARIANDFDLATFFESSITHAKHASPKQLANWLLGKLSNMVNEKNINFSKLELSPVDVSSVVDLYVLGNLSQKQAGELLEYKHGSEASIEDLIAKHNMSQISDIQELSDLVDKILIENQVQFDEFKSGNDKVIGYLIGKVMQASKGKANPKVVKEIIESK